MPIVTVSGPERTVVKTVIERVVKVVEKPIPAALRRQIRSAQKIEEWRRQRTQIKTYALEALDIGFIKIGKSRDVKNRVGSLQTAMPCELRVLFIYERDIERELHGELAAHRARGEWFFKNESVMSVLRARAQ